jgi:hypothetical protein
MWTWLRLLANAILGKTGKPDRADTATRMALDADFSDRGKLSASEHESAEKIDPIDELKRIIGAQRIEPPGRAKAPTFPKRRRRR